MIIEAQDDVIHLQGRLDRNVWPQVRAAAGLLPVAGHGVIIDCSRISGCSADGLRTLREALEYITERKARIIVSGLPVAAMQALRTAPGTPSLPTAASIEEARLCLTGDCPPPAAGRPTDPPGGRALTDILVPLVGDVSPESATVLARHLARTGGAKVRLHLVYVLEVPRVLPMTAPLLEEEARASQIMEQAQVILKKEGFIFEPHVTRARDIGEEIVSQALEVRANMIVLGYTPWLDSDESGTRIIKTLMSRSPCEIVVSRPALPA